MNGEQSSSGQEAGTWARGVRRVGPLEVRPNVTSTVGGQTIKPGSIGLVVSGSDQFLRERKCGELPVPETFSSWSEPFERAGERDEPIAPFAIGRSEGQTLCLGLRDGVCEAAFRALTGGGRFTASDYSFHATVPLVLLEGPSRTVAVSPAVERNADPDRAELPTFEFSDEWAEFR